MLSHPLPCRPLRALLRPLSHPQRKRNNLSHLCPASPLLPPQGLRDIQTGAWSPDAALASTSAFKAARSRTMTYVRQDLLGHPPEIWMPLAVFRRFPTQFNLPIKPSASHQSSYMDIYPPQASLHTPANVSQAMQRHRGVRVLSVRISSMLNPSWGGGRTIPLLATGPPYLTISLLSTGPSCLDAWARWLHRGATGGTSLSPFDASCY